MWKRIPAALALPILWVSLAAAGFGQAAAPQPKPIESLSAAEFSRLSREFSEDGGHFRSDNFVSNETSYLHIVDKMRQLGASGGAYLGVGPEQNFTYIAKVRPRIAFIIDIRRQAVIQHMMYKAIFHLSPTPGQFLSRLLSKPLPPAAKDKPEPGLSDLLAHFEKAPRDEKAYALNLAEARKLIQEEFKFPLSESDLASLDYVYRNFRDDGMEIAYRMESSAWSGYFPSLKEILLGTDLNNKLGNFLAIPADYEFVRDMHRKNLIIPVVGNFGGKKAIASVGDYLRKNGLTVTAFYTSNVEQYLFGDDIFADFVANVKKLPVNEKSLFIRAVAGRMPHPARIPGHRLTTLLQLIPVFLKDFDEGSYPSYTDMVTTHFIGPDKP
ncbi:MAG: hypothetical protein SF339_06225 [Blastocatellia bacterium]|nr:hypothetical protein [Blastocatellia bacterium]